MPLAGGASREILNDVLLADWLPDGNLVVVRQRQGGGKSVELPIGHAVFDTSEMKPLERRYYDEVVKLYESYLTRQVRFSREATKAILPAAPRASGKTLLRRIFRYAIAAGYFAPRAA